VTRFTLATLAALFVLGAIGVVVARVFGASGSRPAAVVTVTSHWIAAWVLWTFVGALAVRGGVMTAYEPAVFGVVALCGGWLQYRALVGGARDRARAIFVGGQLGWLVVVLVQNGLLASP
jgi:hypothetical protein